MDEFFQKLDAIYEQGEPDRAEGFLLGALRELENAGRDRTGEAASVLNELGGFYRGVSRYAASVDCTGRAMALLEALEMADTPQYAAMLVNQAGAYRLMGRHEESAALFLRAKALLEAQGQQESYAYVSLLNNLSLAYAAQSRWAEAIPLAESALARIRRRPGAEEETATALTNLASMYLQTNQPDRAEALLNEALAVFTAMPTADAHEPAARAAQGVARYRRGDYPAALEAFRQALTGTERVFGRNAEYASAQRSIALTLAAMGDLAGAAEGHRAAAALLASLLGEDDPRVAAYRAEAARAAEALNAGEAGKA